MKLCKVWIEQCEAARTIEDEFGTQKALAYLMGEKFLNYPEATEKDPTFQAEVPAFDAEIKAIFETWQLAEYPQTVRKSDPFDAALGGEEDPEIVEMERKADLRRSAVDLLLVERARDLLLGE